MAMKKKESRTMVTTRTPAGFTSSKKPGTPRSRQMQIEGLKESLKGMKRRGGTTPKPRTSNPATPKPTTSKPKARKLPKKMGEQKVRKLPYKG